MANSGLPLSFLIFGQIVTLLIACFVAYTGRQQWKTARDMGIAQLRATREKIALDLFDKRMEVYLDVRHIVTVAGQRTNMRSPGLPNDVMARGQFLFGDDMQKMFDELYRLCTAIDTGDMSAQDRLWTLYNSEMIPLFRTYMKMDARVYGG